MCARLRLFLYIMQHLRAAPLQPAVLQLAVEDFPAPEGQVEAGAVHQRHVQLLPRLQDLGQQRVGRVLRRECRATTGLGL